MMRRDHALQALARAIPDDIVVGAYSTAFDWLAIRPHVMNYMSVGAMGLASSHALGLALGRPDRKVVVLDGDGSLLMNLGTLVTIATVAPANLIHFVSENGTYEANGGHPIPGRARVSFAGLARSAGYRSVFEFDELEAFEAGLDEVLAAPGPTFVDLKVVAGDEVPRDYGVLYAASARHAFKTALAA